ncbi:MAG: dihydrofolate reductase [Hyphomicrobiaceae bacterium]
MNDNRPRVALVLAAAENGVIGRDGGLPWHISSDLRFFRSVTLGKPVIMGRRTFESIGRPLDGRDNIVVTRDRTFVATGAHVVQGVPEALELARAIAQRRGVDEIAIIGGGQIYQAALAHADRIYLTEVHAEVEGDTRKPLLAKDDWREISRKRHEAGAKDDYDFSLVVLERI